MSTRRLASGIAFAGLVGLPAMLAGCGGSGSGATSTTAPVPSIGQTTTVPSTSPPAGLPTAPPSTPAPGAGQQDALHKAIVAYQTRQGVPQSSYVVTRITFSPLDPAWVKFDVGPTPADQATFQGGFGIAHLDGTTWTVIGFGSAEVGCPPGPTVPPTVLTSFGISCSGGA